MENKKLSVQVGCKNCNNNFLVCSGNTKFKQQFQCNDEIIFLTYYTCPQCGEVHFSQIDNSRTLEMSKDVSKQFARLSRLAKQDKLIPQKRNDKFKKTNRHLAKIRKLLMDEYTGKTVVEVSSGNVVENLTFDKSIKL